MAPSDKRKPVSLQTGSLRLSSLAAKDIQGNNIPHIDFQTSYLCDRLLHFSQPVARAVAELHLKTWRAAT
jgi:hypothetical protein